MEQNYSNTTELNIRINKLRRLVPFYQDVPDLLYALESWENKTVYQVGCMGGNLRSKYIDGGIRLISNQHLLPCNPSTFSVGYDHIKAMVDTLSNQVRNTGSAQGLIIIAYEPLKEDEGLYMYEPLRFYDGLPNGLNYLSQRNISLMVVEYAHSDIGYPY